MAKMPDDHQKSWSPKNEVKMNNDEDMSSDEDVRPAILPLDGGFGWVIVIVGFMGGMIVDGIIFSFGIVYSELLLAFDSGKGKTAWVGSVMAGMYLTVGPIVSALANRYGCRNVCIIGAFIGAIGLFLSVFATSVNFLIFSYGILGGIGFGFIYLPCIVMVQFYFDKKRAFATGISVCGSGMGAFVLAPLSTLLISYYGWRGNMLVHSAIVMNMVALGGLLRPLEGSKRPRDHSNPPLQWIKESRNNSFHKSNSAQSFNRYCDVADYVNEDDRLKITQSEQFKRLLNWSDLNGNPEKNRSDSYISSSLVIPKLTIEEEEVEEEEESVDTGSHLDSASSNAPLTATMYRNRSNTTSLCQDESSYMQRKVDSPSLSLKGEALRVSVNSIASRPSRNNTLTPSSGRRISLPLNLPEEMKRPFYRQDVFYSGSLLRIPQYTSQPSLHHYHCSVMSIPKDTEDNGNCLKTYLCPKTAMHTIRTMLDLSLLKSVTFLVLCTASFITMMGFFVPFVYLADYAKTIGLSKEDSGFLFSIIGIANTLGRVFSGWVSDRPKVNALLITNIALTSGGLATAVVPFLTRYDLLLAYSSIFGLAIACFASLRSIILVELLGLEKLTNAFGLLLLFQGIASMIGSPMAGFFYDITRSYDTSFIIAGSLIALSGILGFPLSYISQWENRKRTVCALNQNGAALSERINSEADINASSAPA